MTESRSIETSGAEASTLEGSVRRVVYVDEEKAWGVVRFRTDAGGTVAAVGRLFGVRPGERLRLTGRWEKDPKFGLQFRVDSFLAPLPETVEGIRRYLGSGLVPGIGKVMARRLVERFGIDTLDVIERRPERLAEVDGIGPVRSRRIRECWLEQRAVREVMLFLQTHEVGASLAGRIFKRFGQRAIAAIKDDPYRLAEEVSGIGFDTADRIARRMGVPEDAPSRAEAGALWALGRAADEGHLFLPRKELVGQGARLLGVDEPRLAEAVDRLARRGAVVVEADGASGPAIYRRDLHRDESAAAERLAALLAAPGPAAAVPAGEAIERFTGLSGLELEARQRRAVELALSEKALVITGGPGTGKTTLVRAIVEILTRHRWRLALAAPTGRAAKRLAEATGAEVKTLHRLLEFDPRRQVFQRHGERPLEADLVLVDEASMVDTPLVRRLLEAVPDRARLVLVGDVDQLAPVGPGKVLEEILRSGRVPVARLERIFRQAGRSRIVDNAHRVDRGELPDLAPGPADGDFFFLQRSRPEDVIETLRELVGRRIAGGFGLDPRSDVQVLTPMRRGLLGVENLNRELQGLLNPAAAAAAGGGALSLGDRVMQIRNNYELEVFNGDVGRVVAVDAESRGLTVEFEGRRVDYDAADRDQLHLAYACSVHKSQGSEYPCVVLPLHTQHYIMLQRNLLYTAITRARRLMIIVGERRAVARAVRNDRQQQRYTRLAARLRAAVPGR